MEPRQTSIHGRGATVNIRHDAGSTEDAKRIALSSMLKAETHVSAASQRKFECGEEAKTLYL
jgi:hypothetical protein